MFRRQKPYTNLPYFLRFLISYIQSGDPEGETGLVPKEPINMVSLPCYSFGESPHSHFSLFSHLFTRPTCNFHRFILCEPMLRL